MVSSIQEIPLVKIRESKTNPRRFFDEAKLAELAAFVR
jgi:ParB-like chromosome segregation protein Spo0J